MPGTDTIIATTEVVNAFNAQFVPFSVNCYLQFAPTGDKGALNFQLSLIFFSNIASLLAIVYLTFIPWKKGPDWYLKFSPFVFFGFMYLNYLILPLSNIALMVYFTINPNYDLKVLPLETWVIFFTIICFTRVVEYFTSTKKIVLDDARVYL